MPYQGVRYHLKYGNRTSRCSEVYTLVTNVCRQWSDTGGERPQNYKELYNLRHSVLRSSAAECGFGLFKGKWRRFKTQTVCKTSVMSSMITASCYLHNFCIDSNYAWAGHEDIFSPSALTQLRSEFVEALQQASGAMVGSDTVSTAMPAASDSDEDVTEDDGVMGDASSVPVRDEIAHLGWRKYQEALKARLFCKP